MNHDCSSFILERACLGATAKNLCLRKNMTLCSGPILYFSSTNYFPSRQRLFVGCNSEKNRWLGVTSSNSHTNIDVNGRNGPLEIDR